MGWRVEGTLVLQSTALGTEPLQDVYRELAFSLLCFSLFLEFVV